ncbi:type II toxin-antitoxin system HigB family toxin [Paraburkholderia sp. D15]|uniref:type II toxin-antitoxin system HigB family toxin n=1 Tax=Paraburkholderia sp. D15 TaxID=2880218 RepID=UPI00247AB655|nr:type II toxin-antitoxin system HigB family toxin [Paraburkholderia sp. D15]WGS51433.1 type II toxin-antitoxin system HigB family toxin [Paraburkholderia sp. D15]
MQVQRAKSDEDNTMRVISKKALLDFINKHPGARGALMAWYALAQACLANSYNDLKRTFAGVDYVPPQYTVFDVGGNKFRIVAAIHYNRQSLFVRHVLTHAEYDLWTRKNSKS